MGQLEGIVKNLFILTTGERERDFNILFTEKSVEIRETMLD